MVAVWKRCVPICLVFLCQWTTIADAASTPVTYPRSNQFVAINSDNNVSYSCTVNSPNTVVWEVERSQIRNQQQFDDTTASGIFIAPMNTDSDTSTISVSRMARDDNMDITVQCLASQGINTVEGERYRVITFDAPDSVQNLELLPSLELVWTRPQDVPSQVAVNYTVEINSTDNNGMNFQNTTTETAFSVRFLEGMLREMGSDCVEFEFFVSATNDAGTGPPASVLDTVPISPDVTDISNGLRVEKVDLSPLSVDIYFPPVDPCSNNFPLLNYSLNIDGGFSRRLSPSDVVAGVPLRGLTLPGLTQDNSFSLTVTACNVVTCRNSTPTTINTTDVQSVVAVFFENRLFVSCSFADDSQARGCILRLTLSGVNEIERIKVARPSGSLCATTDNQQEAYSSVVVLDWEADGMDGNVVLDITTTVMKNVSSFAEYVELTGCMEGPNVAAVVGGVFGGVTVALIIAIVIVVIVLCVVGSKSRKTIYQYIHSKLEQHDGEEGQLVFACDVTADEECSKKLKNDLLTASRTVQDSVANVQSPPGVVQEQFSLQSLAEKDSPASIEVNDPDQPLIIKVRWKPLVQSLVALNSLREDARPLLPKDKDLSKVKVKLDMS